VTGHLQKKEYGGWMIHVFRLLARFKFLRGMAFDPFGCTAERKAERRQIEDHSRYGPAGDAAISLRSSSAGNTLSDHNRTLEQMAAVQ